LIEKLKIINENEYNKKLNEIIDENYSD